MFHLTAPAAHMVLDLPSGGIESVANRHIDVFVCVVRSGLTTHDQLRAARLHIHAHLIEIALVVMLVRRFHDDVTAHQIVGVAIEFFRALANPRLDRIRPWHVLKNNL